jgi:predicted PurR-regulated permease PerM
MGVIDAVFKPSQLTFLTQNSAYKFTMFLIVFFSLYSLIRMIDTYNHLIEQNKTYDIKMSLYHKNNINRFNITFIITNVVLMGLLIMMTMGLFNNNSKTLWGILFLSFVPMLLQIGFSTSFSGMKYDFISQYSRDIQSKYDDWKKD